MSQKEAIIKIPGISTSPLPTIRSTASPVSTGIYKVSATLSPASNTEIYP